MVTLEREMKKILAILVCVSYMFCQTQPTQDDFNVCYEKLKNSQVYIDELYGVVLKPSLVAIVPKNGKKPKNYIKFDPYLGLYLVASNTALDPVKFGDELNFKKSDWVGVLEHNATQMGHIKAFGENLGTLDTLSFKAKQGILSAPCCAFLGISVGDDKFIGARYLKHFMKSTDVFYGDIGATFEQKDSKIFVSKADPFGRAKMLLKGDEILSVNAIKPASVRAINEMILFSDKKDILEFEILRQGEKITYKIPVFAPLVSEKPKQEPKKQPLKPKPRKKAQVKMPGVDALRNYGLALGSDLIVKSVRSGSTAQKMGFERGDKILKIDEKYVNNLAQINQIITKNDRNLYYFLVSRDDFQFFIKVKR